ncbi:VapC toxin family PIN domain ribonuclease [Vandammella animalimorsus]|uniref:Ribonuclease VapC n=1 Tax=Vandammella animalimorsus TaxID=2029117 RepID=A0A2A2A9K5_9BURK|nr:TA system VapC family ribonuclease toxin [Vandammella animalimorsus]PAT34418.1 VapC toxin family PIN domain ribonuclease [Vandammella animalimorsus]PAT40394.1 VapC toxin family PIN domain ribonuclease [Vandammella animalimorsus]
MLLPDTNVLLNAVHADSPQHAQAKQALEAAMLDTRGMALAWVVLIGFVRLSTKRGILPAPLDVADALGVVDEWLAHPRTRVLEPGPLHAGIFGRLLLSAGTAGNLTNDAHIAALAIEHQAEVLTFDKDFARFSGLRYQLLA